MSGFRVIQAGPLVTVQDQGRPGLMRFGLPHSGPMDRRALAIANAALGNPAAAAGIEVSPGGLEIEMTATCTVAIAGGGFIATTPAGRMPGWAVLTLLPGERLRLSAGPWGNWCYLAFAGGVDAPHFAGHAATHAGSGLGGGVLKPGQALALAAPTRLDGRDGPIPIPVWARPRAEFDLVIGPQDRFFSRNTLATLTEASFTITPSMDRMGVRLAGPALMPEGALGIPSGPICRGSLQVSGEGTVTVLMADHQTTGGYPRIATLTDLDCDSFAQARPGQKLRFRTMTAAQAVARHRAEAARRADWLARLSARGPVTSG